MTSIDLAQELVDAITNVKRHHFDYLEGQGVGHDYLWLREMRFGVATITVSGNTYEPAAHGKAAIIMPAIPLDVDVLYHDPADLVAFLPSDPSKWWCRCGTAPFLNPEAVERVAFFREPLRLKATPFSWLKSGGQGAVILDDRAHLPFWLGGVTEIVFEDLALARRVKARMRKQERALPAFFIEEARAAA